MVPLDGMPACGAWHVCLMRWLFQDKEQKRQRRKQAKSGTKMMVRS